MALSGVACFGDLHLRHAGVHDGLNDRCPVHEVIITIVIACVNTIVIEVLITIAI